MFTQLIIPPVFDHTEEEEQEKGVWVIHCRDKAASEECVVSNYRSKIMLPQLLHFIDVLQLPLWVNLWDGFVCYTEIKEYICYDYCRLRKGIVI